MDDVILTTEGRAKDLWLNQKRTCFFNGYHEKQGKINRHVCDYSRRE
jgi:hypothetical protein